MMIRTKLALRALVAGTIAAALLGACSSDEGSESPQLGPKPANTKRSAACTTWQNAMCAFLVTQCSQLSQAECSDDIGAMFCKDDATMEACTGVLPSAPCTGVPTECGNVVDTAPAIWYCQAFGDALCGRGEACGLGAKSACLTAAAKELDCSTALGATPTIDTCLEQLASWSCDSLKAGLLPNSCMGALKVSSTYSATSKAPAWLDRITLTLPGLTSR